MEYKKIYTTFPQVPYVNSTADHSCINETGVGYSHFANVAVGTEAARIGRKIAITSVDVCGLIAPRTTVNADKRCSATLCRTMLVLDTKPDTVPSVTTGLDNSVIFQYPGRPGTSPVLDSNGMRIQILQEQFDAMADTGAGLATGAWSGGPCAGQVNWHLEFDREPIIVEYNDEGSTDDNTWNISKNQLYLVLTSDNDLSAPFYERAYAFSGYTTVTFLDI